MQSLANLPPRTWAEIDLAALRYNLQVIHRLAGPAAQVMAVVKANAYGHGVVPVVQALRRHVEMFGVANVTEAIDVRFHAPETPILILSPALPAERAIVARNGFLPSVSTLEEARAYSDLAEVRRVPIHLVVDTGMGRIGIWEEELAATARAIIALPGIEIAGISSHLPVADEDAVYSEEQLERFRKLAASVAAMAGTTPILHLENSAGIMAFRGRGGDLVRAGLMLYGSAPLPKYQQDLRPVLSWKVGITLVRAVGAGRSISYGRTFITPCPMRIATLAVGYADGFSRHLSNQGAQVLIGGKRCSVLGRVTMDQIMVDVSSVPEAVPGGEAVILGRQGAEEILASELAEKAGTIAWDIFTSIGPRVQRIYLPTALF